MAVLRNGIATKNLHNDIPGAKAKVRNKLREEAIATASSFCLSSHKHDLATLFRVSGTNGWRNQRKIFPRA